MSFEFAPGWELTNTSTPEMTENAIREKSLAAINNLVTVDKQFLYLKGAAVGTTVFEKVKVTKGLHQEEGSGILPESHVQLEIADFPFPKRFHLYFWYVTKNKKRAWYPYRLTHIDHTNGKATVTANIE